MQKKIVRFGLFFGGLVSSIIGVAHFFMPLYAFDPSVLMQMDGLVKDHFVYLAIYMLGSFLLGMGLLSLYFATSVITSQILAFILLQTFLWWVRVLLEVLFPVNVSLFGVPNPTEFILPVVVVTAIAYTLAYFYAAKSCKEEKACQKA